MWPPVVGSVSWLTSVCLMRSCGLSFNRDTSINNFKKISQALCKKLWWFGNRYLFSEHFQQLFQIACIFSKILNTVRALRVNTTRDFFTNSCQCHELNLPAFVWKSIQNNCQYCHENQNKLRLNLRKIISELNTYYSPWIHSKQYLIFSGNKFQTILDKRTHIRW